MKKITPVVAVIALLAAGNANAISAGYRAQLERSGCTQVTEADGTCDIHKTAAQNGISTSRQAADKRAADERVAAARAAMNAPADPAEAQQARAILNATLEENVLAQDLVPALNALKALGFHQVSGEYVNSKGDHVTITVDKSGKVRTVNVKP